MVVFIFNDRLNILTDWLPNNRVLIFIEETYTGADSMGECQARCLGIELEGIEKRLVEADVMFDQSETKGEKKTYILNDIIEGHYTEMHFATTDSTSKLISIRQPERAISCDCE
jgi:hypothetical protein